LVSGADDLRARARQWRTMLEASGVTAGDRILHALPSGSAVARDCWSAALELGAVSTSTPRPSIDDLLVMAPTVLVSTPTDALRLGRTAAQADTSLVLVIVTGEAGGSIGSTRRRIEDQFGARCIDVYQLVEAGIVGWSCGVAEGGVHLAEDEYTIESIEPHTDQPVDAGRLGELVITTRTPRETPLVRYRTGDLVQLSHGGCTCGNPWVRAEGGVRGRLSERRLVRGIELLPSTIEHIVRRHPAVVEYRLLVYEVRGECELSVQLELDAAIAGEDNIARASAEVSADLRRSLGLRLPCEVVPPASLNDQDEGRRARRFSRQ